MKASFYSLNYI